VAKTVNLNDKILISTPLGSNKLTLQPCAAGEEQHILMESSEEKKES